ncbi:MAG TPA: AraC family transcriptional regulator, partial [Anseongella sp.]|nr:AraC family transcriptional regulator [Anseongella sp.]
LRSRCVNPKPVQIDTTPYGPLSLAVQDGRNYAGPRLSGTELVGMTTKAFSVNLQQLSGEGYHISLLEGCFQETTLLSLPLPGAGLQSIANYKAGRSLFISPPRVRLQPGQYAHLSVSEGPLNIELEKNSLYQLFLITYTESLLRPLYPFFEGLQVFLEATPPTKRLRGDWGDARIDYGYAQLLGVPYEPPLRSFLYEDYVRDLLIDQLLSQRRQPVHFEGFSAEEIEKLHRARALVLQNLKAHLLIPELSRAVGLNEFTLKEGFRALFNKGPFALLKDARMELAHDLLLHTDRPIKEIVWEAGYSSITSFVKAFREAYGVPPGRLRSRFQRGDEEEESLLNG